MIPGARRDINIINKNITQQSMYYFLIVRSCFQSIDNFVVTKTDEVKVSYRLMPSSATNFVGRADYLSKLEEIFTAESGKNDSRPVAILCAMGGMGKSQIAIKFAETRCHL
jgi:Holliday junction resolvasome RuvABC ATP-dependent DNA helicase subunit